MTLNADEGSYQHALLHEYSGSLVVFHTSTFLIFQYKGFGVLVSFFLGNRFHLYSLLSAALFGFFKKRIMLSGTIE